MSTSVIEAPFGPEDLRRRRKRALAMALVLVALVIAFFITTIVRMGGHASGL
jgi:hypothetical protein